MLRCSDLEGYKIKNVMEKVATTLFADDTTVYLSAKDSFTKVTSILDRWCKASSAKFNVSKTEIIPIGSREYRPRVIQTRKMNVDDDPIPENVHIAIDGESIRILGARIGNGVDIHAIWTPMIEKVDSALERWGESHPALEMRRHICQITIGSMTQYLAQVNGMPKSVEKQFIKTQRGWMWGGSKSSPVQHDMLLAPIKDGGKNMFDLTAQTEALVIMKLQGYLELDPSKRATWAFVTDSKFATHDRRTSNVATGSHVNMFTQSFTPKQSDLPPRLKEMVTVAKKYGLIFDTYNPSQDVKGMLPLFHHFGEDKNKRRINNTAPCKCLRVKHRAQIAQDGVKIAAHLDDPGHLASKDCMCLDCVDDRAFSGCKNPHSCAKMAKPKLDSLIQKWDPRIPPLELPAPLAEDTEDLIVLLFRFHES
jgi:hypothetical protein